MAGRYRALGQLFAFGFYRLKSIKRKKQKQCTAEGLATKSMTGKPGRRDGRGE